MPFGLGVWEILILLLVLLLIFGARRLPSLGRDLGKGMREFKEAITPGDDGSSTNSSARRVDDAEVIRTEQPKAPSDAEASDRER